MSAVDKLHEEAFGTVGDPDALKPVVLLSDALDAVAEAQREGLEAGREEAFTAMTRQAAIMAAAGVGMQPGAYVGNAALEALTAAVDAARAVLAARDKETP